MCRSKHVEPLKNFGIINSITKLHLVGISTESYTVKLVYINVPVPFNAQAMAVVVWRGTSRY